MTFILESNNPEYAPPPATSNYGRLLTPTNPTYTPTPSHLHQRIYDTSFNITPTPTPIHIYLAGLLLTRSLHNGKPIDTSAVHKTLAAISARH